ncbi:hypothetical protein GCM10025867_46290 (plasmid) [Frondihabitans sucicola]|uniref:Uncharacterized protein n=1 Tax=Frondihabitans sucicola TaxID=1268041 RepID=A0ABM8GV94_9MICO|nr:hypothetical protein [Frondihabitans sucicola]BDZ52388.1 hypothetical protein GCM10025867_46290 [Frondihabitans sucicola]
MSAANAEALTDHASLDLLERGYKPIDEFGGITVGTRVRNTGHQYPAAYQHGTATVVAVMEKSPSSWSQYYGARDIEIVVDVDDKTWGTKTHAWASYGTALVTPI